jgi:membrane protease YdiL (CAAX protease family)
MDIEQPSGPRPNWRQIGLFVGLTFLLTYALDLALYLVAGGLNHPAATQVLQLQMLIPAAVAIVLQLFIFKDSPIYHVQGQARWFFLGYLLLAVLLVALATSALLFPNTIVLSITSLVTVVASAGSLLLVVLVRLVAGKEAFAQAGLRGGQVRHYVIFGLALLLISGAMTGLNALFNLGQPANVHELLREAAGGEATALEEIPAAALLLILAAQNLLVAPLLGLVIAFGEEYGWRGYLQSALIAMGKIPAFLLIGIVWGLWHAPIIAMGFNYPGHPILGILLMTIYTIALAFFFGYAVLKSGSVWLAAFLHALNNAVASFLLVVVYRPDSVIYSFGLGIYGLLFWAAIIAALLILDRQTWTSAPRLWLEAVPKGSPEANKPESRTAQTQSDLSPEERGAK